MGSPMTLNKILPKAVIIFFILSLLFVTAFIDPGKTSLLSCQFKQLTGHSCPTCGMTRSFHTFSHFSFRESFGFHLMGPVIYVAMLFVLIKYSIEIAVRKELKIKVNPGVTRFIVVLFFFTFFCFWIIRFINEL